MSRNEAARARSPGKARRRGRRALPGREPAEGVRLVALELLAQAEVVAGRLPDPADAEALHDFRVAVRRLRSWLRSFEDEVEDTLRKKWRKELKAVVGTTGAARDAEVLRGILLRERGSLPPRHRRAVDWLVARDAPAEAPAADPRALAGQRFADLAPHLRSGLSRYQRAVGSRRVGRFGTAAARAIREQADALSEALAAVEGADDVERAHRARIEGKRLRYLLEPLRELAPAAGPAVRRMKALQDCLGDLHDVHVLAARIADAMADAAAEGARAEHQALHAAGEDEARAVARRSLRPGLRALDRRVRERRDALHAELRRTWLPGGEGAARLGRGVAAVVAELSRGRRGGAPGPSRAGAGPRPGRRQAR